MITIIFAVFAVICIVFIAYLLNWGWKLESEIDSLQSRLAFAGKNYTEMKNKLNEDIRLLKTKINDKNNSKKKTRQTVESKNKRSRKLPGMRKKGVS